MPRIYVGTYAKYNAGSLAGAWLDLEDYTSADEFGEACRELHKDESDPELMFQDHEDIPADMIGESHLSPDVWAWLELDESDRRLLALYRDNVDNSGNTDKAREAFMGKGSDPADIMQAWYEDTDGLAGVPEHLRYYIDWDALARDADGITFVRVNGDTWGFRTDC